MIKGSIERAAAYGMDTPFHGNNSNRLRHPTDYDGETRRVQMVHAITNKKGIFLGKHENHFVVCTYSPDNGIDGCEMYEHLTDVQKNWRVILPLGVAVV